MDKIIHMPGRNQSPQPKMPDIQPSDAVCGNCIHCYQDEQTGLQGACRRYPPTVLMIPQQGAMGQVSIAIQSMSPPVVLNYSCGEFERKEQLDIA